MQMPGMRGMSQCPRTVIMLPPVQFFDIAGDRLQLTADQKQKIKDIMDKATQASRPLVEKSAQANDALKTALFTPGKDAASIQSLANDAEKAEDAIISADLDTWNQIKSVLTADQLPKLRDMMTMGPRNMAPPMARLRVAPPAGAPPPAPPDQ